MEIFVQEYEVETYLLPASLCLSSILLFWKSAAPLAYIRAGTVKAEKINFFEYIFN